MNINKTLTCRTCTKDVDVRIGLSNRDIQPLSFACPHCSALLHITISRGEGLVIEGAHESADRYGPFDGRNPFVDLHLDFPVWVGAYAIGGTPFMVAVEKVHPSAAEMNVNPIELVQFHTSRVNQLNHFREKARDIRTIIGLYHDKDKGLFKRQVEAFLGTKEGNSLLPQDVNATLYKFLSFVFLPFLHHGEITGFVNEFTEFMMQLAGARYDAFNEFVSHLDNTKFLENVQRDCLGLYPKIYDAELPLRPALFLDFVRGYERNKIAARVSNEEFGTYKDMYKDLAEIFGRQLVLVAGINNLVGRGHHDSFGEPANGNPLSSLDKFADKTLTDKFKYLDECWYNVDREVIDTSVRNAIAHYTARYDEVSQIITYFPVKEGVRQERGEQMYFLDFMRMILQLFREVHYLHHVIKALFFYKYIVLEKKEEGAQKQL